MSSPYFKFTKFKRNNYEISYIKAPIIENPINNRSYRRKIIAVRMEQSDTFSEVLDILKVHGDEIMMALYGNECKADLKEGDPEAFDENGESDLFYYDCYHGGEFFPMLFGLDDYNRHYQLDISPARSQLPLEQGYVYHFLIETRTIEAAYGNDQNHYFTIFYGERTILLQTWGGYQGILVKYIHGDISEILAGILRGNSENYRRLFEIPEHARRVLQFDTAKIKYVKQIMMRPTLERLNIPLSKVGLNYAKDKLSFYI